ncbi:MAG: class I SAM-dependent methyltransferase [Ignavibacteria bacterium]|nr:class I SAM-dependent methyltransferase [Ignavibacteria bacterium]
MYSEISEIYDLLFPLNLNKIKFIDNLIKFKGKIIDAGCASGELSIELSKKGYDLTGIDLDNDMIEIAKSRAGNNKIRFISGSISEIITLVAENNFDSILCWGNTLPHLKNENEIKKFISGSYSLLNSGGVISIQLMNYEKIINEKIKNLPVKKTDDFIFKREYEILDSGYLKFITEVFIKRSGKTLKNYAMHYPVLQSALKKFLIETGFTEIITYSDFNFSEFTGNEISYIINGMKHNL